MTGAARAITRNYECDPIHKVNSCRLEKGWGEHPMAKVPPPSLFLLHGTQYIL